MLKNIKDFAKNQFRLSNNGPMQVITCGTVILFLFVVIRFVMRLLGHEEVYEFLINNIALPTKWADFITKPWTIFTYSFVQKTLFSATLDFLLIHSFGRLTVNLIGNKTFLKLHMLGIVGGGLMVLFFYNIMPSYKGVSTTLHGLDGSIYAIIAAIATLNPSISLMLLFFGRVKLKHVALFFLMTSLFSIDSGDAVGVCQIGGMLVGYLYAKFLIKNVPTPFSFMKKFFWQKKRRKLIILSGDKT